MGGIRNFAGEQEPGPAIRNVDGEMPDGMRQEILAATYNLLPLPGGGLALPEDQLYYGIEQMLGVEAAANPHGGMRQRLGRDLARAPWPRIYDVVSWLWAQFGRAGLQEVFRQEANRILAAYGSAWELREDGHLVRVLPLEVQNQVIAAIAELADPRFAAAAALFNAAGAAYDERPRRDREACANIFDALESVAKVKYNRPDDTFGQVKNYIEQNHLVNQEIVSIFTSLNHIRNQHFGHGMAVAFGLSSAEVDFAYLSCIASILLLTRTPDVHD